ncbi:878_t:CDS:1, partial [Scutellospora calospora]
MALSDVQVNEILEKHMKIFESNILYTKMYTHHENIRNHLKQYIIGTCSKNTLYNVLYPMYFALTCGHLDTPLNRSNINKYFNIKINAIDNDINIYKTQNKNIAIENAKKTQEMNQINLLTTQLNQEKSKTNTLSSQLDQVKNNNQQFINQINTLTNQINEEKNKNQQLTDQIQVFNNRLTQKKDKIQELISLLNKEREELNQRDLNRLNIQSEQERILEEKSNQKKILRNKLNNFKLLIDEIINNLEIRYSENKTYEEKLNDIIDF